MMLEDCRKNCVWLLHTIEAHMLALYFVIIRGLMETMCSTELGLLLVHTHFGNCLALRIYLRISLLHFPLKDVKFIQSFCTVFQIS